MKNQSPKTTRRDFLAGTSGMLVAGLALNIAPCLADDQRERKFYARGSGTADGAVRTLFGYIERVAPNMEVFPWRLLCPNIYEIRRVATLTFDRYFEFYQFKKRVLESAPSEIEECVEKIDGASSRAKALILTGIYLYDCVYHENSRLFSFLGTRRNYGADYGKLVSWSNPDNGVANPSLYPPNYRYYYPYRFPVCQPEGRVFRSNALIGSISPSAGYYIWTFQAGWNLIKTLVSSPSNITGWRITVSNIGWIQFNLGTAPLRTKCFAFRNSLGGIDTIHTMGDFRSLPSSNPKVFINDGRSSVLNMNPVTEYEAASGPIVNAEQREKWRAFLLSPAKYIYTKADRYASSADLVPIILTESSPKLTEYELSDLTFKFRFDYERGGRIYQHS